MKLFKYTAEHISRMQAIKLVREFEAQDVDVGYADMDPAVSNQFILVAAVSSSLAGSIRARIWEENSGARCDMMEITQDQLNCLINKG